MAISAYTSDPSGLIGSITNKIDTNQIATWNQVKTEDYTQLHRLGGQWKDLMYFELQPTEDHVYFRTVWPNPAEIEDFQYTYAVYHSELTQLLVAHCHDLISNIEITPTAAIDSEAQ